MTAPLLRVLGEEGVQALGFDLRDFDPKNPAHREAVDRAFGLEPSVPFGRAWFDGSATTSSAFEGDEVGVAFVEEHDASWRPLSVLHDPSPEEVAKARQRIEFLLGRCYDTDREVVGLHLEGLNQDAMAERLRITQPVVVSRLAMARARMLSAAALPDVDPFDLAADLRRYTKRSSRRSSVFDPRVHSLLLAAYYWMPNQSAVARRVGLPPRRVRDAVRWADNNLPEDHPVRALTTSTAWGRWPRRDGGVDSPWRYLRGEVGGHAEAAVGELVAAVVRAVRKRRSIGEGERASSKSAASS